MAKELPYFKFEPSEWEAGNIQAVSREAKGLFIEICSLYWIRLGELPYALALQKLCNGNASEMQCLKDLDIIGVNEGQIIIEFLDEQLDEFQKTSEKRANAANKRWKNAKDMQVHSNCNAIREEKKKEEKKKEEKKKEEKKKEILMPFESNDFLNMWNLWKQFKKQQFNFTYKSEISEQAALTDLNTKSNGQELSAIEIIKQSMAAGYKGLFELKENNNGKAKQNIAQYANKYLSENDPDYKNY